MNILVTGGTGYIGKYFIPELLRQGHRVRLLVRNLEKARKLFANSCDYFVGDVTEKKTLCGCCKNIDIVFHMVAKVGNELPNNKNFTIFYKVNVEGTKNLIEESKKGNIQKFIFVSSIAAMGIVKEIPINEKSLCRPYLPYQVTKFEAEKVIKKEYKENNFPAICVRPTKVYGVGEHEYSYLTYAKLCKKHIFFKIGKGKNYLSNIYILDFVQALIKLVDKGIIGETYILSSEDSIAFAEMGKLIADVLNKKIWIIPVPSFLMIILADIEEKIFLRIGKKPIVTKKNIEAIVTDRIYDIKKAKKDINYEPQFKMEDGIKKTIQWYIDKKII